MGHAGRRAQGHVDHTSTAITAPHLDGATVLSLSANGSQVPLKDLDLHGGKARQFRLRPIHCDAL